MNAKSFGQRASFWAPILAAALTFCADVLAAPLGTYTTAPGSYGEYMVQAGEIRTIILPLDVTMEFTGSPASLTATMHTPIIGAEADGTPIFPIGGMFPLTVMAVSTDGVHFEGNLQSQYFYSWDITPGSGGELVWNGSVAWVGGRLEHTAITDVRLLLVPEPASSLLLALGIACLTKRSVIACR